MSVFCGEMLTIEVCFTDETYLMKEDKHCFAFTDEMIECKVEDETRQKFNVGDIIAKAHLRYRILKIEDDRYIVEETPGINLEVFFKDQDKYRLVEEGIQPLALGNSCECPQGYQFVDENGNVINTQKIALEKKNRYPTTHEECCKVLGVNSENFLSIRNVHLYNDEEDTIKYERDLVDKFDYLWQLIICRDAYWKIAGEEMGLGKPWKPDWENSEERRYSIVNIEGDINLPETTLTKGILKVTNKILVFPTEEIRDTFYENFKELIEQCKELL